MELYKYDKALELEQKILSAVNDGKLIKAKVLMFRYNILVEKLRRYGVTDIPLYKIKDLIRITDDSAYVSYHVECGFCGHDASRLQQAKDKVGNRNVRLIRVCSNEACNHQAQRYIRFKLGLLTPKMGNYFQRLMFNFSTLFR